jgi:hypothetical protein
VSPGQVESGRTFEFGIAYIFNDLLKNSNLIQDSALSIARQAFNQSEEHERQKILKASNEIVRFLISHDKSLLFNERYSILLQKDKTGEGGDVRDIVVRTSKHSIGISAKNRHTAVKHSRLSDKIDFGKQWFDIPCSLEYHEAIGPIFLELRQLNRHKLLWRDLENKSARFYVPILSAFHEEISRICESNVESPRRLVEYLIGKYDFYKVIKENGDVLIQSFNLRGTLGWGKRIKLPRRLIEVHQKEGSDNTLQLAFDEGWQLSFRIHNAESLVKPSLKFDIQIIGYPPNVSQHEIHYVEGIYE